MAHGVAPILGFLIIFYHLCLITGERIFHNRDRSDLQERTLDQERHILTPRAAQHYLWKYGWIEPVRWESLPFRGVSAPPGENIAPPDISFLLIEGRSTVQTHPMAPEPTLSPRFQGALRRFQEANGLTVTGELDDDTRRAMNAPRCGVPDHKAPESKEQDVTHLSHSATTAQQIRQDEGEDVSGKGPSGRESRTGDTRGHLRWGKNQNHQLVHRARKRRSHLLRDGVSRTGFAKTTVKWRLLGEGYSIKLSVDQQRYVLKIAFRIWSEVVPLNFEEDQNSHPHLIDIKLGFGTRRHLGCSQLFDGMGREFAHAWQLGDIHFNDDEHFVTLNSEQGISLLKVAVHEIGHVLGLKHMNQLGSVMQPNYIETELDQMDRRAIQKIYGRCSGKFSTVFDWVIQERGHRGEPVQRFYTYFFRRGWYWRYENHSNRTRRGDPRKVELGWVGIPTMNIDAFLQIRDRGEDFTAFFKGTLYWRYDNENDRAYTVDPEGHVYPRLISEGFPGISGPIDSAYFNPWDRNVHFFHGKNVSVFSVETHKVLPGYPKPIRDVYPGESHRDHPVGDLDAVYFSYIHESIFFIKDTYTWRVAGTKERFENPDLPHNALLPRMVLNELWLDICDVHPSMLSLNDRDM